MNSKINERQRLFIIPCSLTRTGHGFTTLGFDRAFELAAAISRWLMSEGAAAETPHPENRGTLAGYREYRAAVHAARNYYEKAHRKCPAELTPQFVGLEGRRVEVVDAYGERRRFYVGKSTGWIPCHLEIARIDSTGGPAVTGAPFVSVRVVPDAPRRY